MVPNAHRLGRAGKAHTRNRMLLALMLMSLAFVVMAPSASAARAWCRTDPIVLINGTLADVFVSGPLLAPLSVTGPTKLIITVPDDVKAQVLLTDLGFLRGYNVVVKQSSDLKQTSKGVEVRIAVYVPARDSRMPVKVEFAPRLLGLLWTDAAEGTANQWITLDTFLATGLL